MPTPMPLAPLPDAITHADAIIRGVDECFLAGFARLGSAERQALAGLARVFAQTPLESAVTRAVAAATESHASEADLTAIAAGRESLSGACYDALYAHASAALGHTVAAPAAIEMSPAPAASGMEGYLSGTRQWLAEIALAGFRQLEAQTVMPFAATLEALQSQPSLGRLAALLTGFFDELMDSVPTTALPELPERRWVDLWSRAMLGAAALRPEPRAERVSGTLRVLGGDIRHHDHMISLAAYGIFEASGEAAGRPAALVRTTVSAWKVDAVAGDEIWTALLDVAGPLLAALSERKTLTCTDMILLATGDLVWDSAKAKLGSAFDPVDAAAGALAAGAGLRVPLPAPLDRHPVQLAVPVALAEAVFTSEGGRLGVELGGAVIPLALSRTSPRTGLDFTQLRRAKALFGLLRYDSGELWLQPLVAKGGGAKPVYFGPSDSIDRGRVIGKKGVLPVLQERASKLLRKSTKK